MSENLVAVVLVLGAVGSFLGGISTFLEVSFGSKMLDTLEKKHKALVGGSLIIMSILLAAAAVVLSDTRPPHEQLTSEAWGAYDDGDYEAAIRFATECVTKFSLLAEQEQRALKDENAPMPPTSSFTDDDKREIFSRGVLNDVATSYFILGESALRLERFAEARYAYEKAVGLDYARTWDPGGWFWSPAASAKSRLAALPPDA